MTKSNRVEDSLLVMTFNPLKQAGLFLLLTLVFSGCPQNLSVGPTTEKSRVTDAEYAVLSVAVDPEIGQSSEPLFVLDDSTRPFLSVGGPIEDIDSMLTQTLLFVNHQLPALSPETMEDFKEKNLTHAFIDYPTRIHSKCVLDRDTNQRAPRLTVGRAGISRDNRQALVYAGYIYGPEAGAGFYYLLSRRSSLDKWAIVDSFMAWIS